MPRITIYLTDDEVEQLRKEAFASKMCVNDIIENVLRKRIEANKPKEKRYAYKYEGYHGNILPTVLASNLATAVDKINKECNYRLTYISEVHEAQPPMPMPCGSLRDNGTCSATFAHCATCPNRPMIPGVHHPRWMRS